MVSAAIIAAAEMEGAPADERQVAVEGHQAVNGPVPLPPNVLGRLSTRVLVVGTGDERLIAGFIIAGTGEKRVLIRALGPSLESPGVLADPTLSVFDSNGGLFYTNDNWMNSPQRAEIAATGYAPPNDLESAGLPTLSPGAYTMVVAGSDGGAGIATAEVIDVSGSTTSELVNISSRARANIGDHVVIAGFTIDGPNPQKVVLRGIGPSLARPDALRDPTLLLRDHKGTPLAFNDNWKDTQQAQIQATAIPPPDDRESAIVATLLPGSYTAESAGVCGSTGKALVEVFRTFGEAVAIPPSSAMPICVAPTAVVSRKSHGAEIFDIALPMAPPRGIECRGNAGTINDYQVVFTFPNAVTFTNASITSGTGSILNTTGSGTTTNIVNLTGIANAQTLTVTLGNVNDGTRTNDVGVQMGVLVGDTNASGSVSSSDVGETKTRAGQSLDALNFRNDVNASGAINALDIGLIKSVSGTTLP